MGVTMKHQVRLYPLGKGCAKIDESNLTEVNNYYPYGMLNKSMSWQLSGNNHKYHRKKMQKYFDYNVLDFGVVKSGWVAKREHFK